MLRVFIFSIYLIFYSFPALAETEVSPAEVEQDESAHEAEEDKKDQDEHRRILQELEDDARIQFSKERDKDKDSSDEDDAVSDAEFKAVFREHN